MPVQLSAFPKCYLERITHQEMSLFEWIDMARALDADGLEMYEGFFESLDPPYLDRVCEAIQAQGFVMPMLCCSPDFTAPDPAARHRAIDHEAEMIAVARRLGGPGTVCRILTGQRYPEVSWELGRDWVLAAFEELIPIAREHNIVLGLENHFKDGFWKYPEFAQAMDRFVDIVNAVNERTYFGVQYDPSNAIVAGDDPLALLRAVAPRIVSMHASDRYWKDGALVHGVTGQGLNDYPAIFHILAEQKYSGWISIEDGMNGMDEMAESLKFLRKMVAEHFNSSTALEGLKH